jgi:uncharacterized protein
MVVTQWKVRPPVEAPRAGVWVGPGRTEGDGVWLGSLAEVVAGKAPRVWLAGGKEQVVAVVGKRGSGKSFTLGVIAESLAAEGQGELGRHDVDRAVLLFDPLDVYWTTRYPVAPSENFEVQRHYALAMAAGLTGLTFDVEAWIPGSDAARESDPGWFRTLLLSVPALGLGEWELLLGVNAMQDPMGQALADALVLTRDTGYHLRADEIAAQAQFGLPDLANVLRSDELSGTYHPETLRALRQRLAALGRTGLFAAEGTTVGDLLAPGRLTVVMLGRLTQSYRAAVVAVLTRLLIDARSRASFAEKRLVLDPEVSGEEAKEIRALREFSVPRTVVALDEAQSFLAPGAGNPARELFVRLVKEGRNMGLSAVLATQQPSALDQRVLSQVETFVAHQLVTESDIRAVRENLKAELPEGIQFGRQSLDFSALLRSLPPGVCVVSAADVNVAVKRTMVVSVRPRATVHGGIEL